MNWNEIIATIITVVVVPLLTWGTARLVAWLNGKIDNDKLGKYFALGEGAINAAVAEVAQGYVDDLKKGGTWDKARAADALEMAKDKARGIMTNATQIAIDEATGDINAWLTAQIEAAVRAGKAAG